MSQATVEMTNAKQPARTAAEALRGAYMFLQRLVGLIALALPLALIGGGWLLGNHTFESSLSAYYYTPVGDIFVGALCALGVFFLSYQHKPLDGYILDNRLSYGASAAAIGVALLPTAEHAASIGGREWFVSTAHLVCAGALFALLAFFSLRLFTKPHAPNLPPAKRKRNRVHRVCGGIIVGAMVLVIANNIVHVPDSWNLLLWLESVGVVAFGFSWLVKSEGVAALNDPPGTPSNPPPLEG